MTMLYKCQIVSVNDCECVQICPVLHSPPSLTDTLSLIECKYCLKGEGIVAGREGWCPFCVTIDCTCLIECAFTEESFERGNQIGSMHAMPVSDAHSSLHSSSMTIHLTINASISSPSLTSVSQEVGRM
jgi:hypothetical protein